MYIGSDRVYDDGYHPNADTWTTARTITLGGVLSGSVSINGSSNVTLTAAHTSDPTLTLSGDATGSATFTNLGNATLTVTVVDDSHNHIISNVDGLQTALDAKLNLSGGTVTGDLYLNAGQIYGGFGAETTAGTLDWNHSTNARSGNGFTLLLGNATNGPGPAAYYHPFSWEYNSKNSTGNMTQFAIPYNTLDGPYFRYRFGGNWTSWTKIWNNNNDGSGSGLDADLLDGQQGSYYQKKTNVQDAAPSGATGDLWYESDSGILYVYYDNFWVDVAPQPGSNSNLQLNSLGVGTPASNTTGEIRATNDVTAYFSDARLKTFEGIIPDALDKVKQLNGYYFRENDTARTLGYDNPNRQVGVSAQEVQNVLPEVVVAAPISDEYLTVKYEKMVPLLIEAIKELDSKYQTRINELENEIKKLKGYTSGN
jgi:hypothetical protein